MVGHPIDCYSDAFVALFNRQGRGRFRLRDPRQTSRVSSRTKS